MNAKPIEQPPSDLRPGFYIQSDGRERYWNGAKWSGRAHSNPWRYLAHDQNSELPESEEVGGLGRVAIGVSLAGLGIVLSIASYRNADPGDSYIAFSGLVLVGLGLALSGLIRLLRNDRPNANPPPSAAPPLASAPSASVPSRTGSGADANKMQRLLDLYAEGVLSREEFDSARARLLHELEVRDN